MLPDILGTESETNRKGPLSSYSEWHALFLGLEDGYRDQDLPELREHDDAQAERPTFAAGFLLGTAAAIVVERVRE